MKYILIILFSMLFLNVNSQNNGSNLKMDLSKKNIISFSDSMNTNKTYKRYYKNKKLSYIKSKYDNEKIYINPFNLKEDSVIKRMLIDFISLNYDFTKATKRCKYQETIEWVVVFIKVDTNGSIGDCGIVIESNEPEFQNEILTILQNNTINKIVMPIFTFKGLKYSYFKIILIDNQLLWENVYKGLKW